MYLLFPEFNRFSNPLLLAMVLALLFAGLTIQRYLKQGQRTVDVLLISLLLMGANSLICYAVGFMGWYDTYRTTKINYFLMDTGLLIGPLVYWYVRFATDADLRWKKSIWWHFLPFAITIAYYIFQYIFDCLQPGFDGVQNGVIMESIGFRYVSPLFSVLSFASAILYFAFAIQYFMRYQTSVINYFSNTQKVELNWLRNFLIAMGLFLICDLLFLFINTNIVQLHWMQNWWNVFIKGLVTVYLGLEGYRAGFVKTVPVSVVAQQIDSVQLQLSVALPTDLQAIKMQLLHKMDEERLYLNPELTLADLSEKMKVPPAQLSQVINQGIGKNFNDFVNEYRVDAVKNMLLTEKKNRLTLLGIAFECGFNSKATFNRAFKKHTGIPPGEWAG